MQPRSLVHVGWPKTATTYLQTHVFPHLCGVTYLGKPYPSGRFVNALRNIQWMDSLQLQGTDAIAVLREHVESAQAPVVLSSEGLCLSVGRGGFHFHADRALVAQRVRDIFGSPIRILITIREQVSWLESYFLYFSSGHAFTGRYLTAREWFDMQYRLPSHGALLAIDYWPTIQEYRRLFGAENVLGPVDKRVDT